MIEIKDLDTNIETPKEADINCNVCGEHIPGALSNGQELMALRFARRAGSQSVMMLGGRCLEMWRLSFEAT